MGQLICHLVIFVALCVGFEQSRGDALSDELLSHTVWLSGTPTHCYDFPPGVPLPQPVCLDPQSPCAGIALSRRIILTIASCSSSGEVAPWRSQNQRQKIIYTVVQTKRSQPFGFALLIANSELPASVIPYRFLEKNTLLPAQTNCERSLCFCKDLDSKLDPLTSCPKSRIAPGKLFLLESQTNSFQAAADQIANEASRFVFPDPMLQRNNGGWGFKPENLPTRIMGVPGSPVFGRELGLSFNHLVGVVFRANREQCSEWSGHWACNLRGTSFEPFPDVTLLNKIRYIRWLELFFRESFYLEKNPDVAQHVGAGKGFISGFEHLLKYKEDRKFSPFLTLESPADFQKLYGVMQSKSDFREGIDRFMPYFDEQYYLSTYPDVRQSMPSGQVDAERFGELDWSAHLHYLRYGCSAKEIRNPSSSFDEAFYRKTYPDVAAAVATGTFQCGLEHYLRYGKAEGRAALPSPPAAVPAKKATRPPRTVIN